MKLISRILSHGFLSLFILLMLLPIYLAIVAASHDGSAMMHSSIPMTPGTLFLKT